MTKDDTIKILAILKAAYPHSFKDLTKVDADAMVNLWAITFAAETPEEVNAAVYALVSTRTAGYSPTPGEVKEQIRKLKQVDELDEMAAWAMVSKACSNGIYGYREEFAKLPPEVQRAVGSAEQIRAWAMMDADTVESVVASNFQRNFRARQGRDSELQKLPPNVQSFIGDVSEKMRLTG